MAWRSQSVAAAAADGSLLPKVATKICLPSPSLPRRKRIARIDMFSPLETFSERRLTKFPKRSEVVSYGRRIYYSLPNYTKEFDVLRAPDQQQS